MTERTVAGLRCSEVLANLSDYIDETLDAATVTRVEKHLLGCPNCERFGTSFGAMVVAVRGASKPVEPVDSKLVSRLLTRLDALSSEP
jgi:anti-sigma factor RsiW